MVKGTMKGDSAMKQAIEELITGTTSPEAETPDPSASTGERGEKTLARLRAMQDEGGFG